VGLPPEKIRLSDGAAVRRPTIHAREMARQRRLVLHRAPGDEALTRTPCRLANRRRVGRVVLVAPDNFTCAGGMSLTAKPSSSNRRPPVMRRGAGRHRRDAARKRVEKRQKRSAIDRAGHDDRARRIDRVNAEHPLGQIKPTRVTDDVSMMDFPRTAPFRTAPSTTTILARSMRSGRRPPHQSLAPCFRRKNPGSTTWSCPPFEPPNLHNPPA
jgi:hypothetical protein